MEGVKKLVQFFTKGPTTLPPQMGIYSVEKIFYSLTPYFDAYYVFKFAVKSRVK